MRPLLNTLLAVCILAVPSAGLAQTSTRDLLGLKAAGFTDALLIATFQSDGTVYYLTADDLIFLRQQGLSEPVLIAMLATRDNAQPARPAVPYSPPAPAADPLAPVVDAADRQSPVVVNVRQEVSQRVEQRVEEPRRGRTEVVQVPVVVPVRVPRANVAPRKAPEPVYWGFGGQRRGGTWEPARTPTPTRGSEGNKTGGSRGSGGGGR